MELLAAVVAIACAGLLAGSDRSSAGTSDERTLTLYNIHNGEHLSVVYKRGGTYDDEALKKLDWIFRDWRRNEATRMDPKAFDILWEVYQELGSRKPIHIISGFRSSKTNEKLRRSGGGQAKNSQHIEGKALDVHFPDVPVQQLRYSALLRERGGVGYYPTSALPFVHIDTGRVRMWPRMPRHELALLFPGGKSKYLPTDGKPITRKDVETARARYAKLAETIAAFHSFRAGASERTLIASLDPETAQSPVPAPQSASSPGRSPAMASLAGPKLSSLIDLVAPQPVPAARPKQASVTRLPVEEQAKLDALVGATLAEPEPEGFGEWAAATEAIPEPTVQLTAHAGGTSEPAAPHPQQVAAGAFLSQHGWARAPGLDEEHDSELSYRSIPIGTYLTESADMDHPTLSSLVHPDLSLARDAIAGTSDGAIELGFRQKVAIAGLLWSDGFSSEDVTKLLLAQGLGRQTSARRVRTAASQ